MFTHDYFSMNSAIQTYSEPIHFCVHGNGINYFLHREDDWLNLCVQHNFAHKLLILVDVLKKEEKLLGSVYQVH